MSSFKEFMTETDKALHAFGKYVVQQSRSRLTRASRNKDTNSKLYRSIDYKVEDLEDHFLVKFPFMKDLEYAKYQDLGVKGTIANYIENRRSPFSFGTGTGKKGGLKEAIAAWIRKKKFQFRQNDQIKVKGKLVDNPKAGQFMSYKTMTFLISRSIYQKGIPAKHFFSKSFQLGRIRLSDELTKALGTDIKEAFKNYEKK